jgi:hypothetical protein
MSGVPPIVLQNPGGFFSLVGLSTFQLVAFYVESL